MIIQLRRISKTDGTCSTHGKKQKEYTIFTEKPEAKNQHLIDVGVGWEIILKWILQKQDDRMD